jgi:hypothetical protein
MAQALHMARLLDATMVLVIGKHCCEPFRKGTSFGAIVMFALRQMLTLRL